MRRLERSVARRIAIRAQLLDAARPTALVPMVEHLTFLQLDPTAAITPSADLVAYTRLGPVYEPQLLQRALEHDRTLWEMRAFVRPMSDLWLHLPQMRAWPEPGSKHDLWLRANDRFRRFVLDLLRDSGPLVSRDIPDRADVPWASTGWTNDRNVTQMLEFLNARGEVAISGRLGRQRRWDLAERVYPGDLPVVTVDEARRIRAERLLRSLGLARASSVGEVGEPVTVEGTDGTWRLDLQAAAEPFAGRTALLSPFDRLVHDRVRALQLFDFEYKLEMYLPRDRRRWGYFALPVLHHDRLVGKLDAAADRKAGVLTVHAVHEDVRLTRAVRRDVDAEVEALAAWLGLAVRRP